jgi:hypothetical protein
LVALTMLKIKNEEMTMYAKLIRINENRNLVRSVFVLNICLGPILL